MAVQDITGGLLDEFAGHSTCWIELSATDKITGPQTERGAEIASTIAQIHHPAVVLLHQELLHHLKQASSKHPIYPRTLLNKHNSGKRVTSLTPMHRLKGQDSGAHNTFNGVVTRVKKCTPCPCTGLAGSLGSHGGWDADDMAAHARLPLPSLPCWCVSAQCHWPASSSCQHHASSSSHHELIHAGAQGHANKSSSQKTHSKAPGHIQLLAADKKKL